MKVWIDMSPRRTGSFRIKCCALSLVMIQSLSFLSNADTFSKRSRLFKVGPNPCDIVAGDLNGDKWPEIITADRGMLTAHREERPANDELSLLLAEGDLNYVKHHPSLKSGFGPYAIAIANIDALKWPDILVAGFHAVRHRNLMLFLNLQQEKIYKPVPFRIPSETLSYKRHRDGDNVAIFTKPGLTSLAVRDLNGDGLRDCIATAWSSDVLVFLPGHKESFFDAPQFIDAPGGPRDLAFGDFNRDGNDDLAVSMYASAEVALWKGDGAGGFEAVGRFPTRGKLPATIKVCDFNGDKNEDILVAHRHTDDSLVLFSGDGDFSFSLSQEIMLGKDRTVLEHEIQDFCIEDFNGDKKQDIAVACFASGEIQILLNTTTEGAARQRFQKETYHFDEGRPRALTIEDFNQDGAPDIAVALWDLNAVGLLLGKE